MSKRKTSNKLPPFVPLTWNLLHSAAYKNLAPSAAKALPYFIGKVQRIPYKDPARYSTTIVLTYSEARTYRFGKTTFYNIIKSLMRNGFIDPVKKGGLRGGGLSSNNFTLSKRWELYGTSTFEEIKWECFHLKTSQVSNLNRKRLKSEPSGTAYRKIVSKLRPVEGKKAQLGAQK